MKAKYKTKSLLKETLSKCSVCHNLCPAQVVKADGDGGKEVIIMRRHCPCHGTQEFVISTDARFYWLSEGNPINAKCGCGIACSSAGDGRDGSLGSNALDEAKRGTMDKLSTCLALIEIVDSCNLACPTCFADSPVGMAAGKVKYHTFENLKRRIQGIIDQKGRIEIVQFSGGEPTLHPEFFRLVEWVRSNPDIDYLIINTNGVRFADDEAFVQEMGKMFAKYDNIQLYLQFDGPQEEGQIELRGRDLREKRNKAILNCQRIKLPITLAMTVTEENLGHLWDTVNYARPFENIRGVSFQPVFLSGRLPVDYRGENRPQPITVADIILGLNDQSSGAVRTDDFTPLPCGDPNCSTIGWLMRIGDQYFSPTTAGISVSELQASLPDRINYNLADLAKCGCEGTQLGELMKRLEVQESNAFRLFIKPFMGSETWDEGRIDRCCTHVIRPDGKLDSFCRYYAVRPTVNACC